MYAAHADRSDSIRDLIAASRKEVGPIHAYLTSDVDSGSTITFNPIRIVPAGAVLSDVVARALPDPPAATLNGRRAEHPCAQGFDRSAGRISRQTLPSVATER